MKFVILLLVILSGCAYPSKKEAYAPSAPDKGMAVVYLYRPSTSIDRVNPEVPRFYVNDNLVGKLSIGGYYRILVKPGAVTVINKGSIFGVPTPWRRGNSVSFSAEENKTYFVKYAVEIELLYKTTLFAAVPNNMGEKEIVNTRLLVN